jgi:hypothetical protein
MKTITLLIAVTMVLVSLFIECDDDFLIDQETRQILYSQRLDLTGNTDHMSFTIDFPDAENRKFTIVQIPRYIIITPMHGGFSHGKVIFDISTDDEVVQYGHWEGFYMMRIRIEGYGYLNIETTYQMSPETLIRWQDSPMGKQ